MKNLVLTYYEIHGVKMDEENSDVLLYKVIADVYTDFVRDVLNVAYDYFVKGHLEYSEVFVYTISYFENDETHTLDHEVSYDYKFVSFVNN